MKKILLIILILCIFQQVVLSTSYTSQYPIQDADHVKATSENSGYEAYVGTNPALSLTGTSTSNAWRTVYPDFYTNIRFHIDLGSAKIIRRIYYENFHHSGGSTYRGVNNFTFWGSNTGAGTFDDLIYANDEGWTELTCSQNTMDEHVALDQADPKYITVTNTTAYRYYAFKFADTHGDTIMGNRRFELQTEDGYPPAGITWNTATITKWNTATITKWNGQ